MEDHFLARKSKELISRNFGIEINSEDDLHAMLTQHLKHLLDQDFEGLLNALYRIDLAESLVKKILHEAPPSEMASKLAEAIIIRQKTKVKIREAYKKRP